MLSQFLKWGGPACLGKWVGMEVLYIEYRMKKKKNKTIKTKPEIKSMNKKNKETSRNLLR